MLSENRSESIFLPVVALGYIYTRYDSLSIYSFLPWEGYTGCLFTGFPRSMYLIATLVSAVGGAIIYQIIEHQQNESEVGLKQAVLPMLRDNRRTTTAFIASVTIGYLVTFLYAPIALLIRLGNSDIAIVGGVVVYLILFVTANAELLMD